MSLDTLVQHRTFHIVYTM